MIALDKIIKLVDIRWFMSCITHLSMSSLDFQAQAEE